MSQQAASRPPLPKSLPPTSPRNSFGQSAPLAVQQGHARSSSTPHSPGFIANLAPHSPSLSPSVTQAQSQSQWQPVVSPQPVASTPHERVLAIQTTRSSAPTPASASIDANGADGFVFSGDFARPVNLRDPAELVERCTAEELKGVSDWALNMRLVDLINNSPSKAEHIITALMPRVTHRDHQIGLTALALLEALVKNCPSTHSIVGQRPVLDLIVNILPKQIRDPLHKHPFTPDHTRDVMGMERYDRILVVLQSWGKSFPYNEKAPGFHQVYKELLNNGVKFAEPDRDETAPVFTPLVNPRLVAERAAGIAAAAAARSSLRHSASPSASTSQASSAHQSPLAATTPVSGTPVRASPRTSLTMPAPGRASAGAPSQLLTSTAPLPVTHVQSKSPLKSPSLTDPPIIYTVEPSLRDPELQSAFNSVQLVLELLDNSEGPEHVSTDELINSLLSELRKQQSTVINKLQRPSGEDRINQLLAMNDILTNAFTYYDGLALGTMRRRDQRDEARRVLLATDSAINGSSKPEARRASSHDVNDRNVKIVKENQQLYQQWQPEMQQSQQFNYAVSSPQTDGVYSMNSLGAALPQSQGANSTRRQTWHPQTTPLTNYLNTNVRAVGQQPQQSPYNNQPQPYDQQQLQQQQQPYIGEPEPAPGYDAYVDPPPFEPEPYRLPQSRPQQ